MRQGKAPAAMPGPPSRQPRWGGMRAGGHGKPTASISVSSRRGRAPTRGSRAWGSGWGPAASEKMIDQLVIPLVKIVIVLNATLVAVTYMVLLERKVIAWARSEEHTSELQSHSDL